MLTRDPAAERRLYDALRLSFGKDERTGIHLSSLLNPMMTYWDRKNGRGELTDAEIGYFTAGRGHEDIVTKLLATDFESTPEEEIDGIHLRPDFVATTDRIIPKGYHAELKTRRANLPKDDKDAEKAFSSYRKQVRGYMALKRQPVMYLIVLSLLEGKTKDPLSQSQPVIAVYREEMTEEELTQTWTELQNTKTLLELGTRNLLPLCPDWMCGRWRKLLTATDSPKDGTGSWHYQAKCRHYQDCKPFLRDKNRGERKGDNI